VLAVSGSGAEHMARLADPMPPPWMRHPDIPRGSLGWRMGYGEGYQYAWSDWYGALSKAERAEYQRLFPEPVTWPGYYGDEPSPEGDEHWTEHVQHWRPHGTPAHSRAALAEAWRDGDPPEMIFFWKPRPGAYDQDCLGQWQPSPFTVDVDDYTCAEQYMMAEKARLFDDDETAAMIMRSADPKEMRALGRRVRNFDQRTWNRARHSIVLHGNYAKFTQDPRLREYLLGTGSRVLVEASPLDTIWGIGLPATSPKAADPADWRGQNLLGFALMEVRDEIARVWRNHALVDWSAVA
jgi:ribA/ribD-fused uncharacterized protein